MALKTTAAFSVLATAAALFAFSVDSEATDGTARGETARNGDLFLAASFPLGDFIGPLKGFEELAKIEGHTKKEVIDALNRCKLLVIDQKEWRGKEWTFPRMQKDGWPKLLLEGKAVSSFTDKKARTVTLAVDSVEMGGSTTLPRQRKFTITVFVRRINQGAPTDFEGVLSMTHQFGRRLLNYNGEGKVVLSRTGKGK